MLFFILHPVLLNSPYSYVSGFISLSEDTGLGLLWKTFPCLVDTSSEEPQSVEGAAAALEDPPCTKSKPDHRRNSTHVKEALDKQKIVYKMNRYTMRVDISCCCNSEEVSAEGDLMLDYLAHTANFREAASEKLYVDFLAVIKDKCVEKKGDVSNFVNDMDVFVISG